ncbi:putative cation diffusion facilitator family metal ion transporter [Aureobasidium namibiae CBS 147.97]|uniref:Putative cation diffusion facilitator family metal ion transporter n=1 Tax=Aureobasidium namibiae CBS 147.97 TaxID=1043004 RepID=A0A074WDW5_9PEZI
MARSNSSTSTRLIIVIVLSSAFFVAELVVGFRTKSLALIADAFHYLNDLIAFCVALVAAKLSERKNAPASLAFGWGRAKVLGAFFNGSFLIALGLSIFLQAIERFINIEVIDQPLNVLIMGCIGLLLNVICILTVHADHGHHHHGSNKEPKAGTPVLEMSDLASHENPSKKHAHGDLGVNAIVIHILGDVLNNLGVIAAALVMMLVQSPNRFYADPAVSMGIAIMIASSALPLTFRSGHILLGSTPPSAQSGAVMRELSKIPGVVSVHDLCVWQLSQEESIASAHIVMSPMTSQEMLSGSSTEIEELVRAEQPKETQNGRLARLGRCLHEFGIQRVTLQIEDDPAKTK